jgi:hypothetical protein
VHTDLAEPTWLKKYAEEILMGLLVCLIWAGLAWLFHEGNSWSRPIFYGLVASSLLLIAYFIQRKPKSRIRPSVKNIESCVRTWLDNHKVTVKNDPRQDCHFRFVVTLDSGCILTVYRSKTEYQEYVTIFCDLGVRGAEDKKVLELFGEQEKAQIMLDIKTELARAKVGYGGLVDPPENFHLFRRVPIYPTLTEFAFIMMIGDVEAARNLVMLMFLKARMNASNMQPITSGIPKLASPKV